MLMRRMRMIPVLVALIFAFARPVAVQAAGNVGALTCFAYTGRWEVRLVAPGYQRISAYTWAFDSAYLAGGPQWRPATAAWWGGPDRTWTYSLTSPNPRWDGPYNSSLVLYSTHNTGTIYIHEYQLNAQGTAWEAPRAYSCPITQWVPPIYNWPNL
jgi:hypothetical protein